MTIFHRHQATASNYELAELTGSLNALEAVLDRALPAAIARVQAAVRAATPVFAEAEAVNAPVSDAEARNYPAPVVEPPVVVPPVA